jgi:hypothetical protein
VPTGTHLSRLTPRVPPNCALNTDLSSSMVVLGDGFADVIHANEFSAAVLSKNVLARPPLAITAYGNRVHCEPARLPACALVSTERTPPTTPVAHEYVRSMTAVVVLRAAFAVSDAVLVATTAATIPKVAKPTTAIRKPTTRSRQSSHYSPGGEEYCQ